VDCHLLTARLHDGFSSPPKKTPVFPKPRFSSGYFFL
jgi:hypothetical protein